MNEKYRKNNILKVESIIKKLVKENQRKNIRFRKYYIHKLTANEATTNRYNHNSRHTLGNKTRMHRILGPT